MIKNNHDGTITLIDVWTACSACGQRVTGDSIHTCSPQLDIKRYQWLRNEFAHGRETYIGESMPSGEKLDAYIDEQLRKAQEK